MSPGDWIALAAFGLTGFGMFCTLIGVMWKWSTRIETRLAVNNARLEAIERAIGMQREDAQLAASGNRIFRHAR